MPSFDIVSTINLQEVKNAVEQAKKELATRYDFRGSNASIDLEGERAILLYGDDKGRLDALREIVKLKLAKRNVSLKLVEFKEPQPAHGDGLRQEVILKNGLSDEEMKKINKEIKAMKLKVSSQIQGTQIRVTGKQRDDLQEAIKRIRAALTDMELQFINFRD